MFPLKPLFLDSPHIPNLWELGLIRPLLLLAMAVVLVSSQGASPRAFSVGPRIGNVPQGTQTNDFSINCSTFVSTYDDSSNPHHHQQQVVSSLPIPKP
jgi:hypothetical protein